MKTEGIDDFFFFFFFFLIQCRLNDDIVLPPHPDARPPTYSTSADADMRLRPFVLPPPMQVWDRPPIRSTSADTDASPQQPVTVGLVQAHHAVPVQNMPPTNLTTIDTTCKLNTSKTDSLLPSPSCHDFAALFRVY
jgi:hypothetical protein